jgi:hypothetical protein
MGKYDSQKAAHNFLVEHLLSGQPFALREFLRVTGWTKPGTYRTYLQKQYGGLIENVDGGPLRMQPSEQCRVTEAFRKLIPWRKFQQQVTQVRRIATAYQPLKSEVLIYDFLMPLANETHLRTTLDALFYKDTIVAKLRTIDEARINEHFPRAIGQPDVEYFAPIISFIKDHFVGYSITHVDGRFRSVGILDHDEVGRFQQGGERYLIDETTAITRFIFPYWCEEELNTIRFLFQELFVRSIIQLADNEEQIWMLENGPERFVHIWRAPSTDEDEDASPDEANDL